MPKPESRLQRKIKTALLEAFPGSVWHKIHGSPMQNVGIGDLTGCVKGVYCNLEVKIRPRKATPAQLLEIRNVRRAGGIAGVVYTPEQAVSGVRKSLFNRGITV